LDITTYKNFIDENTTLYEFLDFSLITIEKEFKKYNLTGGFIAYLDETKVSTRFKIISSFGNFLNSNKIKVISAKEIDKLSTVFISKKSLIRDNLYIDLINKNSQDIFIYLEFKENLKINEQKEINQFFDILNLKIKNKNWNRYMTSIVDQVEELPALSQTIIDTLSFSTQINKKPEELIDILSTDPIIIATLLKTVNSAIFGFKNDVESIEDLIYLMGVDFTISIVLSNSLENSINIDISAYNMTQNEFKDYLAKKIRFMTSWLKYENPEIQKKLYLPLILQDLGKFLKN